MTKREHQLRDYQAEVAAQDRDPKEVAPEHFDVDEAKLSPRQDDEPKPTQSDSELSGASVPPLSGADL